VPPTHELTVTPIVEQIPTAYGDVPLTRGYRGDCSCGKSSPVLGMVATVQRWHEWHTTPAHLRPRV
jgi:hypothetical protein